MQPALAGCRERQILESRFRADVKLYLDLVNRLDPDSAKDFDTFYEAVATARLEVRDSLSALNAHIVEHRCG